jgi:hypothetical protein
MVQFEGHVMSLPILMREANQKNQQPLLLDRCARDKNLRKLTLCVDGLNVSAITR